MLAIAAIATAAPLLAARTTTQPAASIVGTVRDSAGAPIANASVAIDDRAPTPVAGDSATFALRDVAPGTHVLHGRALGRLPFDSTVTLLAGQELRVGVRLRRSDVQRLDSVRVAAPAAPRRHRKNGSGIVLTRAEIEERGASRFGDLLRRLPGVSMHQITTQYGTVDYVYVMRGNSMATKDLCPIAYYVDGHPATVDVGGVDALVRPADLDSIEVYANGSQAPPRFTSSRSSRCGVIVLWTRGGP